MEKLELQKFLDFIKVKSIEVFEEKYSIIIKNLEKDMYLFISLDQYLKKINIIIE